MAKYRMMSIVMMFFVSIKSSAQDKPFFDYTPYFSAVIVRDIDGSRNWYESIFGLKLKNEMNDTANGFKIIILESPTFLLELLQLKGSLDSKKSIEGKPAGTKIQGHFKFGFKVPDMNACLERLAKLKIKVPQVWTEASTKKRNFIISDPDGNLIQFFE
jgi:catechol 2,3-dioxygenase-like lactoylglutathione lyase family enzyme